MKKLTLIAAAGLTLVSYGAQAQTAPVSRPTEVITSFDPQTVGSVLNELGAVWQPQQGNGQTFIAANADGEMIFLLAPTACKGPNGSNCVGLSMIAIFEGNANPQTVAAFNYHYSFASAGLDPSGAAYIQRYEISDYGMARGNLATSILVFIEQAKMLQSELATSRRTVALEGQADDLSARALNRSMLNEISGVPTITDNPLEAHQIGLDVTAEQIKFFIENKSAPRNKIKNLRK